VSTLVQPRSGTWGVSGRALAIAFVLVLLNGLFQVKGLYTAGGFTSGASLFYNAVAVLFLLSVGNRVIRRWRPGAVLRAGEMLTVYSVVAVSTGLIGCTWSVGGSLAATITYPFGVAAAASDWGPHTWPYLPAWLAVTDGTALAGYWTGESNPYAWFVIKAWVTPALWWASFVGALMWVCLCLNSVVRRRWSDEEKLAFPLTVVPLQLADERFGLLRSSLWWIGFSSSFGLALWNGLVAVAPSLPPHPAQLGLFALHEKSAPRGMPWARWAGSHG